MGKLAEELVSFELAKTIKKLGFDRPSYFAYDEKGKLESAINYTGEVYFTTEDMEAAEENEHKVALAPTKAVLQRWFREEKFVHINVHVNSGNEGDEPIIWYYSYALRYDNALHSDAFACLSDTKYETYEQALEAALTDVAEVIKP